MPAATDLDQLFDAIVASIKAQFPDLKTVETHRENRNRADLPACLVDMGECEPADSDPGTEQIELVATFEAQIIIGFRTDAAKREVRKLATALAHHVHQQRWGVPCGAAEVIAVEPDAFDADLDRYEIWRVEWRQALLIGDSVWINEGAIPDTVLVSTSPELGPPHEDDYDPLIPQPAPVQ